MGRSTAFVLREPVETECRATENLDGTLTFEVTLPGRAGARSLGEVFFDLNQPPAGGGFVVYGDCGVSAGAAVTSGYDALGRPATLSQSVRNAFGTFDIGIAFGTAKRRARRARSTGFTLAHTSQALCLDMLAGVDFGLGFALADPVPVPVTLPLADPAWARMAMRDAARARVLRLLGLVGTRQAGRAPVVLDGTGGVVTMIDVASDGAPLDMTPDMALDMASGGPLDTAWDPT
mgnify:CR=1 FL=1